MKDDSFEGDWVVAAYRSGDEMITPVEGGEARLTIAGDRLSGTLGVNRVVGRWESDSLVRPLASTMMAGPPELMEQERVLLGHLGEFDAVEVESHGMKLLRDGLALVELEREGTTDGSPTS